MKGRTKWYPRHIFPVRNGEYQCVVRIMGGFHTEWNLEWDGKGFLVPFPMVVYKWRGLTKAAAQEMGLTK
jgi:hypothetical protein